MISDWFKRKTVKIICKRPFELLCLKLHNSTNSSTMESTLKTIIFLWMVKLLFWTILMINELKKYILKGPTQYIDPESQFNW